jgi:hypothetical protein
MLARIFTGPDGQSHFEDMDYPNADASVPPIQSGEGVAFRRFPPGHLIDWHVAPRRQYVITLEGAVEIEIGDGTVRRFGPGDILLAEDVTGQGHISRVVGSTPRVTATVPLT